MDAPSHPNSNATPQTSSEKQDAFRGAVVPFLPSLIAAARKDLRYYVNQGHLHENDFTPEEITGETLIYAWQHRARKPEQMGLRSWLLGTQYRVLRGIVEQQRAYRHDKAISLDAPIPPDPERFDTQEWFWEWYQTEEEMTWEDVIPGRVPVDLEIPLEDDYHLLLEDRDFRHVLMMHDEFEMSLPEVAFTMSRTVDETAALLEQARASLRERLGEPDRAPVEGPAAPETDGQA